MLICASRLEGMNPGPNSQLILLLTLLFILQQPMLYWIRVWYLLIYLFIYLNSILVILRSVFIYKN